MMNHIKNTALFLLIGIIVHSISVWLQSDFLASFLNDNLITLLIALLAINTTTISVIMTKLRDITDSNRVDFSKTIQAMKESVAEQVFILALAAIASVAKGSDVISTAWSNSEFVFNVVLVSIFAASIHILYDTANGVFVILSHENEEHISN